MEIGRKVMNLRLDRGLRQQEMARLCGITASALSKIEAGINRPLAGHISRIARVLEVPVDYLLDEEQPYPFVPPERRQAEDPAKTTRMEMTREEFAYLQALRDSPKEAKDVAFEVPHLPLETLETAWKILYPGREVDFEEVTKNVIKFVRKRRKDD